MSILVYVLKCFVFCFGWIFREDWMRQEVNSIAREYQHLMIQTMQMRGAPKLLRLIHVSQDQDQEGSTHHCMTLLVKISFSTQQCLHPCRALPWASSPYHIIPISITMTTTRADTLTNIGSLPPKARPDLPTQSGPTGL